MGIVAVIAKLALPVPPALTAKIVAVYVPAKVVGVPEMTPVDVFTTRPAGSPFAL
jgi:hypothetical protein